MFNKNIIFNIKDFHYGVFIGKYLGLGLDLYVVNTYKINIFVIPINEDISKISLLDVDLQKADLQNVYLENIYSCYIRDNSYNLSNYLYRILKYSVEYSVYTNICIVKKDGLVCHNILYISISKVDINS